MIVTWLLKTIHPTVREHFSIGPENISGMREPHENDPDAVTWRGDAKTS